MIDIKDDRESIMTRLATNAPPLDNASIKAPVITATANRQSKQLSPEDLRRRFCDAAKNNAASIAEVASIADIPKAAMTFMRENAITPHLLCGDSLAKLNWQNAGINAKCRPASCDDNCAITETIAAAADTGAMLVSNQTKYQLTHSLLPPVHIAVLSADAIMPDLPSVWNCLHADKTAPLVASLFCGPSRTGDIEQTITLGAHGPLKVHIIIYK